MGGTNRMSETTPVALFGYFRSKGAIGDNFDQLCEHIGTLRPVTVFSRLEPGSDSVEWMHVQPSLRSIATSYVRLRGLSRSKIPCLIFTEHPMNLLVWLAYSPRLITSWIHEPRKKGRVGLLKRMLLAPTDFLGRRSSAKKIVGSTHMRSIPGLRQARVIPLPSLIVPLSPTKDWAQRTIDILFFGRIEKFKGLDLLAAALELVLIDRPQLTVMVVGQGDWATCGHQLVALAATHPELRLAVENTHVSDSFLAQTIDDSRSIVLPYHSGTSTNTIGIALNAGVPVAATDIGCFSEYLEAGGGEVVPPDDPVALARALALVSSEQYFTNNQPVARAAAVRYSPASFAASVSNVLGPS
jgi:glycosyltransferase involved in cell wall biosynthesis